MVDGNQLRIREVVEKIGNGGSITIGFDGDSERVVYAMAGLPAEEQGVDPVYSDRDGRPTTKPQEYQR